MTEKTKRSESEQLTVDDEPGKTERIQRGLHPAFQTSHKPHEPIRKFKERPASKGRVHKAKSRN
jgi:hypothetical protein